MFADMKDEDLRKIESILKESSFGKGDHIFSEADEGDKFYIVYEGRVKIYKISINGQVKAFDYLQKGDFFGEMALLDKNPRSANALAMQDSHLLIIRHNDFQKFLINQPGILITITRTLCQRLRKADQEIEMFSFKKVKDRLISCLIYLAEKYGEETEDGIKVSMVFTHQDLSEFVGTAREVVTRLLKELKEENLVRQEKDSFILPSMLELRKKIIE